MVMMVLTETMVLRDQQEMMEQQVVPRFIPLAKVMAEELFFMYTMEGNTV
jgi:hypothetical protein